MEGFVFPTIGAIMQSAVQLIPGGGAGGCSGGGGGGAAADALVSAGNGLMCAMHVEMGRGMGMGAFLMDDADFSMLPPRIEIFQMLGGLIMFRSEEHTSELQSLMRISYAVLCLKKKKKKIILITI